MQWRIMLCRFWQTLNFTYCAKYVLYYMIINMLWNIITDCHPCYVMAHGLTNQWPLIAKLDMVCCVAISVCLWLQRFTWIHKVKVIHWHSKYNYIVTLHAKWMVFVFISYCVIVLCNVKLTIDWLIWLIDWLFYLIHMRNMCIYWCIL